MQDPSSQPMLTKAQVIILLLGVLIGHLIASRLF